MITGKELAQKILDQITAHPETHSQDTWRSEDGECGTTYCIAGWAVALNAELGEPLLSGDAVTRARLARELGTPVTHWGALGRELLGLDDEVAEDLFFSDTEDAPRILAELFDLEYTVPESGE